jgi:two-component system cell cycle sensor histidine kinase/response regulator CckA
VSDEAVERPVEGSRVGRGRAGLVGPRGWSLPAYFAALVAIVGLAAGAAAVYVFVQTDRDSRRAAESDARFAAETAARQLGEGMAVVRATVANLAATPNIEQGASQPSCTLTFGVSDVSRGHVDVLRPDGSVACSSRPRSGSTPLAGYARASWLAGARSQPLLLAPVLDSATGDRSVMASAATARNWVVVAFMALEPAGEGLLKLYGGGDPIEFLVTTANRSRVLMRSIDAPQWVGKPLAGTAFARAAGDVERRDLDGTPRLYAETSVPGVGWRFFAGQDKASAMAAGATLRERQLLIILAGLALVLLATFAVYRRVAVPIRRLGAAVLSSTESTPPTAVPVSGPAEVSELATDINTLISTVSHELVERERAEKSALASERSYRLLFDSSPLPKWIYDAEALTVLAANDAAVARYGYSREEFLALQATDLLAPGEGPDTLEAATPGTLTLRARHRGKDGDPIDVRTAAHPVVFEGRSAICVIAEDVGERERLESRLRQAQKMEAVGQLAGGIAHDFNNLLTVISGYGAMAQQRIGAGPGGGELAEIERAAERAVQLTRQLLAFSRQQILEPVVLDLNEVVVAVTPMLARLIGDDIEIGVVSSDDAPPVLADRGQIEQVILNLAVNGRDAMPGGGTITIQTGRATLDQRYAELAGVTAGTYACLTITDTGTGIDPETQAHIFEPFFTTKPVGEGTGLGLATVHGIVRQSGGHVGVYSERGLGTSFTIYLPIASDLPELPARRAPERPHGLVGSETILVCEDDDFVRAYIEAILTEHGYRVLATGEPTKALDLASSHNGPIEVLVTDVVMPRLSGPELVEQLATVRPDLKVVFLSGYTAETVRDRLPADSIFLQKPFTDIALLEAIRGLIDAGEPTERRGDSAPAVDA